MRPRHIAALLTLAGVGAAACDGVLDPSQPGNLVPRTIDDDPTLPAMSFAGTRFHAETFGDAGKPVIVFLHAGPGGDYRDLLRLTDAHDGYALGDQYRLVFWDQRGSGLSPRVDCGAFSLQQLEQDLGALIDQVSPQRPVILIGHSWGAMYAALYVNHHPGQVAGAVLMEPGPLNAAMFDAVAKDLTNLDPFSEWLNDYVWDSQLISPDDHARADYQLLLGMRDSEPRYHKQRFNDPAPVWRLGAAAHQCVQKAGMKDGKATYDFTDHLGGYTTPVLFIASELNDVTGVAFQNRQRAYFPTSQLAVIAGAGHDMHWSHPAATVAAIRAYLDATVAGKVQ